MSTPTQNADQFLMGGGAASAKFKEYGDTVTGTIAEAPEVSQRTDPKDGSPQFWKSGDPMMQLIVTLQTTLRDDADDDGKRRIYVKGKSLTEAVREAVKKTGARGLEIGGTLTVTYVADGPQPNKALDPPKLYTATYSRPDTSQASGQFLGVNAADTGGGQTFTSPNPMYGPAGSPAPGQPTPEQKAALIAAFGPDFDLRTVYPNYAG